MPRWTRSTTGTIYTPDPVAWESPLNRGLVGWWMGLPHIAGGKTLYNLVQPYHAALASDATWQTGNQGSFAATKFPNGASTTSKAVFANDLYSFNGSSGKAPYTLAFWFFVPTSVANFAGLVWIANGTGYWGTQSFNNTIQSFRVNGTSTIANATFTPGTWAHFTTTFDGLTIRTYLNSAPGGTIASSLAMTSTNEVRFYSTGSSYAITNDAKIWNRALSATEIAAVYQDSRAGFPETIRRTRSSSVFYLSISVGSLSLTLDSATVTGSGTATTPTPTTGGLNLTLASLTTTATATATVPTPTSASLALTLDSLVITATATAEAPTFGTGPTLGYQSTSAVTGPRPAWASAVLVTASPTYAVGRLTNADPKHAQGDPL